MDIYEKIIEDHHNIRDAIEELAETDNSQIGKRNRLLKELERLFVSHTNSEEQTLYSALADSSDAEVRQEVKRSRKEHDLANDKLEALKETPLDGEMFLERLENFRDVVQNHFDNEEDELFDMAQSSLSIDEENLIEEELEDLEDNFWNQPQY